MIVELGLLLLRGRNDRADVLTGNLDEAEVELRPAALTEAYVEFAEHAFLGSFRQVAGGDVVHPGVEIGLARGLAVAARPVEVDVLVDMQPVDQEVLEGR